MKNTETSTWHFLSYETSSFFNPKKGFEMVYGYPKTPLLRTDGERGFVFCGSGNTHGKRYGIEGWLSQNR